MIHVRARDDETITVLLVVAWDNRRVDLGLAVII
jgi:hypothetical protein